jgi:glycine amidinotransferase
VEQQSTPTPVVNTFNEWDPLEEIVVGRVDDSTLVPPWDVIMPAVVHDKTQWDFFREHGGTPWPVDMLTKAERDLEAFIDVLQQAGVTVRQPEPYPYAHPLASPDWEVKSSCYALMPRDVLFVIGDQIIEAPMGWRARSTERLAYRELCKEYFRGGARWVAAPPPRLSDESYVQGFVAPEEDEPQRFLPTEYEPMFDAADAIKCGRDVFIARSSCCNRFGIEWLQRHLGDEYTVHEIEVRDTHPMHIDATFQPLAPGKLLINPERVVKVPDMFEKAGWDVLVCPEPEMPESHPMYNCSRWIMMNVVMLDETRVVVSAGEKRFVRQLREWGIEPVECPFWDFETIGGGFHCASVDIRRRGGLRSYF